MGDCSGRLKSTSRGNVVQRGRWSYAPNHSTPGALSDPRAGVALHPLACRACRVCSCTKPRRVTRSISSHFVVPEWTRGQRRARADLASEFGLGPQRAQRASGGHSHDQEQRFPQRHPQRDPRGAGHLRIGPSGAVPGQRLLPATVLGPGLHCPPDPVHLRYRSAH